MCYGGGGGAGCMARLLQLVWCLLAAGMAVGGASLYPEVPAPAPAPSVGEAAPYGEGAPLAAPSSMPNILRVLIKFTDSTISLNSTGTDFTNVREPPLPGLALVGQASYLGILIYESTDAQTMDDAATVCASIMQQFQNVQFCEPDSQVELDQNPTPSATPNDPLYSTQWDYPQIGVPTVWKGGNFGDKGVRVCVIDSGIDMTSQELKYNVVTGTSFVSGVQSNTSYQDQAGHG